MANEPQRSPSPAPPGAWPPNNCNASALAHIDRVLSFQQRLSSDLSLSPSQIPSPYYISPLESTNSMPGTLFSSDESLSTQFLHDTNTSLSGFVDTSNSTAYTSQSPFSGKLASPVSNYSPYLDGPSLLLKVATLTSSNNVESTALPQLQGIEGTQPAHSPASELVCNHSDAGEDHGGVLSLESARHPRRPPVLVAQASFVSSSTCSLDSSCVPASPSCPSPPVSLPSPMSSQVNSVPPSPLSPGPITFSSPTSSQFSPTLPASLQTWSSPDDSDHGSSFHVDSPSPAGPPRDGWDRGTPIGSILPRTMQQIPSITPPIALVRAQMLTSLSLPESGDSDAEEPITTRSVIDSSPVGSSPTAYPVSTPEWTSGALSPVPSSASPCVTTLLTFPASHELEFLPSVNPRADFFVVPSLPSLSLSGSSPLLFASPTLSESPIEAYSHYNHPDASTSAADYAAAIMASAWGSDCEIVHPRVMSDVAGHENGESYRNQALPDGRASEVGMCDQRPAMFAVEDRTSGILGKVKKFGARMKKFFVPSISLRLRNGAPASEGRGVTREGTSVEADAEFVSQQQVVERQVTPVVVGPSRKGRSRPSLTPRTYDLNSIRNSPQLAATTSVSVNNSGSQTWSAAADTDYAPPTLPAIQTSSLFSSQPSASTSTSQDMKPPPSERNKVIKQTKMKPLVIKPLISNPRRLSLSGLAQDTPPRPAPQIDQGPSSSGQARRSLSASDAEGDGDASLHEDGATEVARLPVPPGLRVKIASKKEGRRFSLSTLSHLSSRSRSPDLNGDADVRQTWRRSLRLPGI